MVDNTLRKRGASSGVPHLFMKTLLVISSGRCVWGDLEEVAPLLGDYDTLGINHMIQTYPDHLDYAASWHPNILKSLIATRTCQKKLNKPITYSSLAGDGVDNVGRFFDGDIESSGMYGACIGLHLGYDKIILVGVPFDKTGHFYDPPIGHELYKRRHYKDTVFNYSYPSSKSWIDFRDKADNKVRVVSGNLIECFSELTEEWLRE
ncbi:MAG: hypothetical protein V3V88_03570 [Dehalococcoidia bacterium]